MSDRVPLHPPACTDARYLHVVLAEYGCCRCQGYHREGEPLFEPHLFWQSKHSYRERDVYDAILEAAAGASACQGSAGTEI